MRLNAKAIYLSPASLYPFPNRIIVTDVAQAAPPSLTTPAAEVLHTQAPAVDVAAIFSHADRLLGALVISEVLSVPIALRRDNLWGPPRVLGG